GHAWRVAGHVSRAVGRFLVSLLRWTFVEPARWVYRSVLTPVGHLLRDAVLRPVAEAARSAGRAVRQVLASARASVRQARADVRRALLGTPKEIRPAPPAPVRGPGTQGMRKGFRPVTGNPADGLDVLWTGQRMHQRAAPTAPPFRRGEEPLGKRQPEGPPPAPAVQRIRLRYTKRGRLRFTSHRDFQRAFERALRRAEVPMAYSAGFTPHPKVSYANAAPTGTGSEAEFLEIALTEPREPERLRALLDDSMPAGLDIIEAVEARTPGLADR